MNTILIDGSFHERDSVKLEETGKKERREG